MDQAQLLSIIGDLYDKLVKDVADRVKQNLALETETDPLRGLVKMSMVDERIQNWASIHFDSCADAWAEESLDRRIENWVDDNLDLEDAAREAIQNSDHLADLIRETVKNDLTFSVSVD